MYKNIVFFTILSALCSNIQAMQKPTLPEKYNYTPLVFFSGIDPAQEAAFEKYNQDMAKYNALYQKKHTELAIAALATGQRPNTGIAAIVHNLLNETNN